MIKRVLFTAATLLFVTTATVKADGLVFYDDNGNQTVVDTDSLTGCVAVFDSGRRPLEICRLEYVESSGSTTVIIPDDDPAFGLGSDRQQGRATTRRVLRRIENRS